MQPSWLDARGGSSSVTMPSSTATSVAHAVSGLVIEASRYGRSRSPNTSELVPRPDHGRGDVVDRPLVTRRSACTGRSLDQFGWFRRLVRPDQLGRAEREVERLATVEPRVAHRLVAVVEVAVGDLVGAAEAFGDVLAGELDVDAARPRALGPVGTDEAVDLAHDRFEVARLATVRRGVGVAVHRVARPHDGVPGVGDGAQQRAQLDLDLVGTHARDQGQPPGDARRVEGLAQLQHVGRR